MTTKIEGVKTTVIDLVSGKEKIETYDVKVNSGETRILFLGDDPLNHDKIYVEDRTRKRKEPEETIFRPYWNTSREIEVRVPKGASGKAEDLGLPSNLGTVRVY